MAILPALKADEIEVVAQYDQSPYQKELSGTKLILHVKGQTVGAILDRAFGMNWTKKTDVIPVGAEHLMKVTLSIKNPDTGEWVSRDGIGSPNTFGKKVLDRSLPDAAKAEETDCLKRAAYEFGLGRELRTEMETFFPNQWINWKEDKDGNRLTYDKFVVKEISYDNPESPGRKIVSITICDETTGHEKTYPAEEKAEEKVEKKAVKTDKKRTAETAVFFVPKKSAKKSAVKKPAAKKPVAIEGDKVILDFGKYKGKDLASLVQEAPSFAFWVYTNAPKGSEAVKEAAFKLGKENPDCRKYFVNGGIKM